LLELAFEYCAFTRLTLSTSKGCISLNDPFVAISICHNANLMKNVDPCSRQTQKYIPMGQAHSKPLPWSNSTSALVCDSANWKLDEEKSKHVGLAQHDGFGPCNFALFAAACKRHSKAQHLP
jgi:hypothetical protein